MARIAEPADAVNFEWEISFAKEFFRCLVCYRLGTRLTLIDRKLCNSSPRVGLTHATMVDC
jgi:hypothetical protein